MSLLADEGLHRIQATAHMYEETQQLSLASRNSSLSGLEAPYVTVICRFHKSEVGSHLQSSGAHQFPDCDDVHALVLHDLLPVVIHNPQAAERLIIK